MSICGEMLKEMKQYWNSSNLIKFKHIMNQYHVLQNSLNEIKTIISKYRNYDVNNKENISAKFELEKRLDEITKQFEEVNIKYLQILDNNINQNEQIMINSKFSNETKGLPPDHKNDDKNYIKSFKEENEKLEELNKEFELVKSTTQKLKEITDNMINEIKDQGKKLSSISDNVIYVKRNMESANKEMKKTEESATNKNNIIIWVVLFISLISIVIIMIYMILYKN